MSVPLKKTLRLVVLASGEGTLLQALIDAEAEGRLAGWIVAVGSDRENTRAEQRAKTAGIPTFVRTLHKDLSRADWDLQVADAIAAYQPDFIICAGFMKILGPVTLAAYPERIINSHPSLLPLHPGAHAVRDALEAGEEVSGCTIFTIDAGVDTGEIIQQWPVPIMEDDTEATLHERIKKVERKALVEVINELASGDVS
ncbi:MAG: phosphoribosylglycinamide formyltransferase [Propionibacteriaceae bacterium]|jgi:formyltetrahydrofolate-dependent phosphoribosylglycinamide formyltransferase|nr:phosphoribosylglycinamide formyltransferase [Propionibacteriaceae bacterium]